MPKEVFYYVLESGKAPFLDWLKKEEIKTQVVVDRYIQRVAEGGARKSIKALKGGIFEIKIPLASGLRVYFSEVGDHKLLLLLGGDKKTQTRDIKKAQNYWSNYGE